MFFRCLTRYLLAFLCLIIPIACNENDTDAIWNNHFWVLRQGGRFFEARNLALVGLHRSTSEKEDSSPFDYLAAELEVVLACSEAQIDSLRAAERVGLCFGWLDASTETTRLEDRLRIQETVLGPEHFFALETRNELASAACFLDRLAIADSLLQYNLKALSLRNDADFLIVANLLDLSLVHYARNEPTAGDSLRDDAVSIATEMSTNELEFALSYINDRSAHLTRMSVIRI